LDLSVRTVSSAGELHRDDVVTWIRKGDKRRPSNRRGLAGEPGSLS
jgi:hypothetical protein